MKYVANEIVCSVDVIIISLTSKTWPLFFLLPSWLEDLLSCVFILSLALDEKYVGIVAIVLWDLIGFFVFNLISTLLFLKRFKFSNEEVLRKPWTDNLSMNFLSFKILIIGCS